MQLIKGIVVLIIANWLSAILSLNILHSLLSLVMNYGILLIIVVFQPELRKALEQIGRRKLFRNILPSSWSKGELRRFTDTTKNDIVKACFDMGRVKTGALIVVEQDVKLQEYERTGIDLDAHLTRQLLINIFEKNTPLHDGAVIVRNDRIVAATCYLPLTENLGISKELGTRHRAAVGISEVSDAITIVVSEETGKVSVTQDGKLYHDLDREELLEMLSKAQIIKEEHDKKKEESSEMDTLEELGITKREDSNVE
jgi:diadenylate cyclase